MKPTWGQDSQEVDPPTHTLSNAPLRSHHAENPEARCCPSGPRPRPTDRLQTHMDQQSHASESRAQCFPPSRGQTGGARGGGGVAALSEARGAVTAAAPLGGGGTSFLGHPGGRAARLAAASSPGPGSSGRGSRARALTTVTGDTMAAAAAAAGTRSGLHRQDAPRGPGEQTMKQSRGEVHYLPRARELGVQTANLTTSPQTQPMSGLEPPMGGVRRAAPARLPLFLHCRRRSSHPRAWAGTRGHAP